VDRHHRDDRGSDYSSHVELNMSLWGWLILGCALAVPFTISWFVWPRVRDEMIWIALAAMIISMLVRIGLTWRY